MTNQQLQNTVFSAIVKVQSAIHDLDSMPLESDFTKQLKYECNKMLANNRNFLTRFEKLIDKDFTCKMDLETSDSYINIVNKFDELGKTINIFEK